MGKPNVDNVNEGGEDFVDELKPGTQLMHGQYTIESFLNAGGFGITYLAKDSLDRKIVIKECFPGAFCRRSRSIVQARSRAHQPELKSIVRLFVQEAKSLAKLNHPNIVGVHQVFEDNETAYMALDFVEGRDMLDTMDDPDIVMTPEQIKSMLVDILGAVQFIHDQDILHRDISPDNILIDPDGRPVLIDFGAAREQATKQSRVLSALRVVKDGYSPQEFYIAGSEQNASSDLYALGASFYHFIKGDCPPNSQARLAAIASGEADPYEPLAGSTPGYDDKFLSALDKSLAVLPKNRVQSAQEWLDMMEGAKPVIAVVESLGEDTPADPVADAVAATAPVKETKSKMGLLLASAAVIAAVGVGAAMTMGGSDTGTPDTSANATTEAAPSAEEIASAAAAAQAAAAAKAEADAAAETQRVAAAEAEAQSLALAEAEAAAEADRVARAEEFARIAAENALRREQQAAERAAAETEATADAQAAAQAQAEAEAEAQAAAETRALAEAQAAEEARDAAEAEARQIAEAEAAAAEIAAEEAAAVAAAKAAELQARADAAKLAAATLDTPSFPAEIEGISGLTTQTGAPDTPLAALNGALPADISLGEILADTQFGNGSGSSLDDNLIASTLPLTEAIPGFVPGNEIVVAEVAEDTLVLSAWSVDLPFAGSSSSSRVIGEVAAVAPVWVDTGVEIDSVNGSPIESINDIGEILRNSVELNDEDQIAIAFGVKDGSTGDVVEQRWSVPIVQQTALLNGIGFETRLIDGTWQTVVTSAPDDVSGELQVGDTLIAYMATGERIEGRMSLKEIMDREIANGTSQFSFAVNRAGNMWIAALEYADEGE